MKALTGRQLEILNFVRTYSMENGCPPTIRECASHFNISLGAIQCHFAALQKKGAELNRQRPCGPQSQMCVSGSYNTEMKINELQNHTKRSIHLQHEH